jgi:Zn-dependent M28 family amino/carboxypeptidase
MVRLSIARLYVTAVLLIVAVAATAAPGTAVFGPTDAITIPDLRRHLNFIASDALEGRAALSAGFRAAAEYIASTLDRMGAMPAGDAGTYFQHVAIRRTTVDPGRSNVALGDRRYRYGDDFLVTSAGTAAGEPVYVGQGWRIPSRKVDPYAGLDVRGRMLVVLHGPANLDLPRSDYTTAQDNAKALGAAGIVTVASFQGLASWTRAKDLAAEGSLEVDRLASTDPAPAIIAAPSLVADLFRGEREDGAHIAQRATTRDPGESFAFKPGKVLSVNVVASRKLEDTMNVVAVIEGSDPVLKHEYVALGAHLDHLGRNPPSQMVGPRSPGGDDIYNGADDDGSGVVALLSMAEAVAAGPRPRRSLLFVWHTGEEWGSWGAKYFTAFPTVPIESIVAQLNVDMIGRSKPADDTNQGDAILSGPDEVYIVGSRKLSQDLGDTCAEVDRAFLGLSLNYKYDKPDDPEHIYERSDHYEYARRGIPVAFYFTGLHRDYHQPSDEVARIDFEKLQRVSRTILATAWTLANRDERPRVDKR